MSQPHVPPPIPAPEAQAKTDPEARTAVADPEAESIDDPVASDLDLSSHEING